MEVFLVDGTYELFRHYYAVPSARDEQGREVGAVRAVLASVLGMIKTEGCPVRSTSPSTALRAAANLAQFASASVSVLGCLISPLSQKRA